ncbi:MAG: beta-galactosidase [Treponema sp.]|nr:beta-galactosidase [Treponema sp.]
MHTFEVKENFYLDGKKIQLISGSIHYFRVVPEYWRDRLEKLKNMGCNTVETYIPWNFHEPKKGEFLWEGWRNFEEFLNIAQELGLYAIVRPSPYICAEWELGGLPAWLLAIPGMKLRCNYEPYLKHVSDYYNVLIPKLVPHQIDHGGNIILIQIENEYGYFGNDKSYLQYLNDLMRKLGITVPFVTSDGPWGAAFKTGQLDEVLPTGNFGSSCQKQFGVMKAQMQKEYPLMCMEFWAGWFDAWGNKFKRKSILKMNKVDFEYMVKDHNVNIYMFHGGTNFGFMNGSNYYAKLTPDTTSYDYDAPLAEDGRLTKKYYAFREIIKKYHEVPDVDFSTKIEYKAFGKIEWEESADLFENLEVMAQAKDSVYPLTMEEAGQNTGYILYRTDLQPNEKTSEIIFEQCADRVQAFEDNKKLFTAFDKEICREGHGMWPFNYTEGKKWKIKTDAGATLDFLVENLGRVNFGHSLEDQRKGIQKGVLINGHRQFGWKHYCLSLDENQIDALNKGGIWNNTTSTVTTNPAFFKFTLKIESPADTYLDFTGWGKGCIFINGFNIGRFWDKGPQRRLYIPAPLLKTGNNKIIIFETEGKRGKSVEFFAEPKFK